ncbi:MAG: phosphotransferase family protein [Acidimicrobiales bacterium]|nr:phosphotransferase family protein [Acidimicrobiales bacterium]
MSDAPTGIDPGPVSAWLLERRPDLAAPFTFELITGGASNLTYRVTDASGTALVLRRPPTGHVLASAHDMAREHRIIAALQDTPVPVPPAVGLCQDDAVNGADFYVMGYVEGKIVFDLADGEAIEPALRPVMTNSLTDTLSALHALDPDEVGLGDLGRKEDYSARQLRRWKRQVDEGSDRDMPLFQELHDRFAAAIPPQQGAGIVHGDYRMDNCMMGHDGSVAAVLDWELCTLGDVLADVAGMAMWWGDDPRAQGRLGDVPTKADGFGSRVEMLERYGRSSERDISDLPWYVAFQHWRLAAISEGVRVRFAAGAMGDQQGAGDNDARASVDNLVQMADEILTAGSL